VKEGKASDMKDNEKSTNKTTFALVGFVCGVLTVLMVVLVMKGC
jgi:hypothetical protein